MCLRLLVVSCPLVQLGEPDLTMSHKRTHSKLVSQSNGLSIECFRGFELGRIGASVDFP